MDSDEVLSTYLKRHPPCGGCGLKCPGSILRDFAKWSPSMRRVWIEIVKNPEDYKALYVTLHAEGVD